MRKDTMVLSAFAQASVSKGQHGAWTHAGNDLKITEPEYYINLARSLERTGFDMVFFDDRLAMPAVYGRSVRATVEKGTRPIKLDLVAILGLIASHTTRIGLGATYSTTYHNPYHVARAFGTLDHLSKGRAIWNIVTSLNADEAANFGVDFVDHDSRYDRADEFLDVTTGLWETWERDALKIDREAGVYADPDKVHTLDHEGKHFSSKGPLTMPQPPQGWPVLLQAGQSARGRQFAARWADLIFVAAPNLEKGQQAYAAQHDVFKAVGRTAPPAKILPGVTVVVGATESIALEKKAYLDTLGDPEEALILLAELSGVDFSAYPMDEPLPADLAEGVSGSHSVLGSVLNRLRDQYGPDATVRDLGRMTAAGPGIKFVGDPGQVADQMCEWFHGYACDGFSIGQTDTPGSFEEFGRYVIPELRKRGVFPEMSNTPQTFRERMGLGNRASR
ncbi:NtaA/DmoA family FMN-dependent monooxygenase [Streptomyces sp. NPDC096311]|uniref:NtaA/DmoA family FMN-dependent monooxygenase n=1 Tax=Streptomyces sp. NPDC096311 TaxID=3366083 RepID=UPI003827B0E0